MGYRGGGMPVARFQEGGFTDAQVAQYFANNPGLSENQIAQVMRETGVSPEQVARVTQADPGYVSQRYADLAPAPAPAAVDPVAQKYVNDFNALINQGNYEDAARLVKSAELAGYGEDAYRAAAVALDANTNLPPELNFLNAEGIANIKSFVDQATKPLVSDAGAGFGEKTINAGMDNYVRSDLPYTQATVAKSFDEQLNELANQNFGRSLTPAEMETYRTDFRGELNDANISDFLKRSQKEIDQVKTARDIVTKAADTAAANAEGRPGPDQILGIPRFTRQAQSSAAFAPLRRGLAQLRTETYAPGLTSGQRALVGSGFTPAQLRDANQDILTKAAADGKTPEQIQADFAYLMDIGGVSPAEMSNVLGQSTKVIQDAYNQVRPGGMFVTSAPTAPKPFALPEDFALQTGAYGAPTPTFLALPEKKTATSAAETPLPSGSIQGTDYTQNPIIGYTDIGFPIYAPNSADNSGGARAGGIIKMAEGGEPPPMSKLSAAEAGSTFDISKYIDDEGRLVGGYSKPIYDENRVITGYEYRPYERDVVFGEELREKEAAMRLTDAEREQMMVEMAMRQGRTGIDPRMGGLAGIEIGDPMMRRRPQYYSTVEQFRPRYAKGGIASIAEELASKGRGGDSMLVHMAPHEVAGLNAIARMQGTELTINPETGMPEALKLGKLFKMLAPMALGFALGPAGAGIFSSALNAGLAVGAGYTLATGSLQQGISAGLGAYGGANLGTGLQAAGTADAVGQAAASEAAGTGLQVAGAAGGDAASAALVESQLGYGDIPFESFNQAPASYSYAVPPPSPTSISLTGGAGSGLSLTPEATGFAGAGPTIPGGEELFTQQIPIDSVNLATGARETAMSTVPKTSSVLTSDVTGLGSTPTPGSALTGAERYFGDKATSDLAAERYADATGSTLGTSAMQIAGGAAGQSAADAERAMRAQQAAITAKQDERKRRFDALFGRTVGTLPARSGGLMKLAGGGMTYMEAGGTTGPTGTPRDVTGTGDGMSDSVPASIEGVQEARLADGEFVIPADVVADIGNGSSDAGSKKLYDMMDRIRKARHGTTEQPPEIQAERLMPA
jgi:hypothetical protein